MQRRLIKYRKASFPPLSLAILHALTPSRHTIKIVNDLVEEIDFQQTYDLVGITGMTSQIERAYQIADRFRSNGTRVVIGGVHASFLPEEAKEHADAVVIGEAEDLWAGILEDFGRGTWKDFYQADQLPELTNTVIPRWNEINLDIYVKVLTGRFPMLMPIFATRGCPLGCKFCSVTRFFGKHYRKRDIAGILEEIKKTGARDYFFVDDNIACDPDYSRELFHALEKLRITWFSQISVTILRNPDLIERASKAGCTGLFIGLESINTQSLRSMGKSFNRVETYQELFRKMREARISPYPSFIFGFDHDQPDAMPRTLDFVKKNGIGNSTFWLLTPIPGTDLFRDMEAQGRILHHRWSEYDMGHVVFRPANFTPDELYDYFWMHFRRYFSPLSMMRRMYFKVSNSKNPLLKAIISFGLREFYNRQSVLNYDNPISGGYGKYFQG